MSLINCSECGKEISDKAESCPYCGNPINRQNIAAPVSQPTIVNVKGGKEGCFLQTLNLGCMITLGFIVLMALGALFGTRQTGETKEYIIMKNGDTIKDPEQIKKLKEQYVKEKILKK